MEEQEKKKNIFTLNKEQWPQVLLLLIMALVGIFLIVLANTMNSEPSQAVTVSENNSPGPPGGVRPVSGLEWEEDGLARELERILSEIQGAGEVVVSVKMSSGPRYEYATNLNTITRQSGGGEGQQVNEDNMEHQVVLAQAGGGGQQPVVVQQKPPEVQGVLVVAEGGNDSWVRWRISRAVGTLLGISADQIEVLSREKGGVLFDGGN